MSIFKMTDARHGTPTVHIVIVAIIVATGAPGIGGEHCSADAAFATKRSPSL